MQISINTADDERHTFEMTTWFDLVTPPPKQGDHLPWVKGLGATPELCAPTLEEPSEKVQVPW